MHTMSDHPVLPFDGMGLYPQPRPRFVNVIKMPKVVPDQKAKFENDELFRRLSRECEVSYKLPIFRSHLFRTYILSAIQPADGDRFNEHFSFTTVNNLYSCCILLFSFVQKMLFVDKENRVKFIIKYEWSNFVKKCLLNLQTVFTGQCNLIWILAVLCLLRLLDCKLGLLGCEGQIL